MVKDGFYPLFSSLLGGECGKKHIKSVTPNVTPIYTFRFTLSPLLSPLMSLQSYFYPKNTPLQPHKTKKTAFNRSKTY